MPAAERQSAARVRQMLDDIQQYNHVEHAKRPERRLLGNCIDHRKTAALAKINGRIRDFDSRHFVKTTRLFQKKSKGAANLEKASAIPKSTDKLHGTRKFTSQNWLAATVISVTIRMRAGKIALSVVFIKVKILAIRAP